MRRLAPAVLLALLAAAACASTAKPAAQPSASPALGGGTAGPTAVPGSAAASTEPSPSAPASAAFAAPTPAPGSRTVVAVPAAKLPYPPAQGAPALDDVTIVKSNADPCGIPADNTGGEAQLIDAAAVANVVSVTFEVTNPCTVALSYDVTVTQAIGAGDGPLAGPELRTTTQEIPPGASAKFKATVDPKATLTPAQRQQLWVGVTHIAKHAR